MKELKNTGFEKDMKIYNLEGELANLGSQYTELQNKYNELEAKLLQLGEGKSTVEQNSNSSRKSPGNFDFSLTKRSPIIETPIILSSIPKFGKSFI